MRAWVVDGAGDPGDVLSLIEVDDPDPRPGEVMLRVEAAGVGLPDALMCRSTYAFSPALPFTPGQEVCGRVVAVGEGVAIAPGERLMGVTSFYDGRGGLAEYTVAPASTLFRVPPSMPSSVAATFRIGYSTALIGLRRRGALSAGERVLVLGAAGGSGITAIHVAKALGAQVIAVVSSEDKARVCERSGADVIIDRSASEVVDSVLEVTAGKGVDLVYDPVGGDLADRSVACLAPSGRLLLVGFASGRWANPPIDVVVRRNISLVGVYAGGISRTDNEQDHEFLLSLFETGLLGSFVREVPFERAVEAVISVDRGLTAGKSAVVMEGA